ncbi:MarR family transcriptional regulator [Secundilactobacillus pentosiphilus]|uniref:MarR family transcriptional regulator n=1 Tax=Secundilactobacillus pentosiphilus TaxID=1714682 RepID=A0A1Z5IQA2_9LACO|nr:MarR family transcriptional regulator [Secundilactobacillus pentosiphilus]GAX03937.1 MarR family transcriptional regulator [Secundilactobacillus pentosiphilus]
MIDTGDDSIVKWLIIAGRQSSQHLGQQLARINVSASQYYYLLKIHDNPGLTQKDLIEAEFINPSNVTRAIKQLVDQGLVNRQRSAKDKRAQELELTPAGQRVYPQIKAILDQEEAQFSQIVKQQFPDFDPEQMAKALQSFARLYRDTEKNNQ